MNARTARRAGRAEWEHRSSVSHAEGAACGPFFETRPTALRFLSGRAAPSPLFAPSRAALMCGNQVQQLGRIPEGAFLQTGKHEEHEEGWVSFPVLPVFPGKSLAGAPPARSRRTAKTKRLARRRDAGAQVAAHTRSAARPTGRRIAASETSPPGGGEFYTPRKNPREGAKTSA